MPRDPTCPTGKTVHVSQQAATDQLVSLKRDKQGQNMHAYRCSICQNFHIGHIPGFQRGNRKRQREKE